MAILRNCCKCKKCGDIIESVSVHNFVQCSCGAVFTDGGRDYIRRGWVQPWGADSASGYADYIEALDETTPDPEEP